jgi:hypothetical protein
VPESTDPARTAEERAHLLARLPGHPGLCADCTHLRFAVSPRSVFLRCGLADVDARFPRYPPLPVFTCAGHESVRDSP